MASEDPFLEVQSDVQSLLTTTRTLYSSYLRIRTLSSSKNKTPTTELLQSRSELTSNLETLTSDLQDLLDSIRAVESDPYKFGLDVAELSRRQSFVRDVTNEVDSMRAQLQDTGVGSGGGGGLPDPDSFHHGDDYDEDSYEVNEYATQQTMMREQDEQLDDVYRTVGTLRHQAEDMGRELEEQGVMLDEVDTLADRVGGKLAVGTKKIGEVIRRNEDSWSGCCIGVLIVVLIVLLLLVIII
ncbi:hypothetical protein PMZ80_010516 [Knufia obscura]|uniref:t-SNARE affecting a late Golgi compartment protein 1 n=2 Tax=Knufia TaxID=430999 RepID=A0AAN8EMK7_9EURO|nr:hypothetical protein PMZ80_010516 [Knufia obscura]KAK5950131.1 hypothetical protein OHC33_008846 [Knufia fluminis]